MPLIVAKIYKQTKTYAQVFSYSVETDIVPYCKPLYIFLAPEYPCPNVWDAWNCYPAARNGTFEHVACPSYTTSSTEQECQCK